MSRLGANPITTGDLMSAAIVALLLFSASCSAPQVAPTAVIRDVRVCEEYVGTQCDTNATTLPADAEEVNVTAVLDKVEDGTKVEFDWAYVEYDRVKIDEVAVFVDRDEPVVSSTLPRPEGGWPKGEYEVSIAAARGVSGGQGASVVRTFQIR